MCAPSETDQAARSAAISRRGLLAAGASGAALWLGRASPAAAEGPATVVAFTGWVPIFTSVADSAVSAIVTDLKSRGISAEVFDPSYWRQASAQLLAAAPEPIVIVGYSMGAVAAIEMARRLDEAGRPVRALIVFEAWGPPPVPPNVHEAVHYYVTKSANPLVPAPYSRNPVRNVDLRSRIPGIENAGHIEMSKLKAVQDFIVADVVRYARQAAAPRPISGKRKPAG